jgi:hypothetical protein
VALGSGITCLLVTAATGPLMACGPCDTSIVPSIVVEVVDSVTGEAAASGALGLATDGQYTDTLEVHALNATGRPLSLATRGERVGNYSVRVTQTGYAAWERDNIQIRQEECHTNQINLTARLQRAP